MAGAADHVAYRRLEEGVGAEGVADAGEVGADELILAPYVLKARELLRTRRPDGLPSAVVLLQLGGEAWIVDLRDAGRPEQAVRPRRIDDAPDATLTVRSASDVRALLERRLPIMRALATRRMTVRGDTRVLRRIEGAWRAASGATRPSDGSVRVRVLRADVEGAHGSYVLHVDEGGAAWQLRRRWRELKALGASLGEAYGRTSPLGLEIPSLPRSALTSSTSRAALEARQLRMTEYLAALLRLLPCRVRFGAGPPPLLDFLDPDAPARVRPRAPPARSPVSMSSPAPTPASTPASTPPRSAATTMIDDDEDAPSPPIAPGGTPSEAPGGTPSGGPCLPPAAPQVPFSELVRAHADAKAAASLGALGAHARRLETLALLLAVVVVLDLARGVLLRWSDALPSDRHDAAPGADSPLNVLGAAIGIGSFGSDLAESRSGPRSEIGDPRSTDPLAAVLGAARAVLLIVAVGVLGCAVALRVRTPEGAAAASLHARRLRVFASFWRIYIGFRLGRRRANAIAAASPLGERDARAVAAWAETHDSLGRLMADRMGELGGLWTKAGQYVATRADIVPARVRAPLRTLLDDNRHRPLHQARNAFITPAPGHPATPTLAAWPGGRRAARRARPRGDRADRHRRRGAALDRIDRTGENLVRHLGAHLGAIPASSRQVHAATLVSGERVVLKVQHVGIDAVVEQVPRDLTHQCVILNE